jgi:arylsulfatase A-like enzyme
MDALPKDTLLIFASDNGPLPTFGGERAVGFRGSKLSLYEGGIRMPFIARWAGHVPAGRVDDSSVFSSVDLFPTFCAIGGAALPASLKADGEDVTAALEGKPIERKKPLFWEYGRNPKSFSYPTGRDRSPALAVRDGKWKLLVNPDGTQGELYDLQADPSEATNVAAEHAEISERLTKLALDTFQTRPAAP